MYARARLENLFASLIVPFVLSGCSGNTPAVAPALPAVSVIAVHHESVPVTTELPGRTSANLVAQVRARVDGIVQQRAFQEGADIASDQRLYLIDPAPYRAALDSAHAQLTRALANVAATRAQRERD